MPTLLFFSAQIQTSGAFRCFLDKWHPLCNDWAFPAYEAKKSRVPYTKRPFIFFCRGIDVWTDLIFKRYDGAEEKRSNSHTPLMCSINWLVGSLGFFGGSRRGRGWGWEDLVCVQQLEGTLTKIIVMKGYAFVEAHFSMLCVPGYKCASIPSAGSVFDTYTVPSKRPHQASEGKKKSVALQTEHRCGGRMLV